MFARLPRAMQYRGADGNHRRLQRAPMAITDAFNQLHIWGAAALGADVLFSSGRERTSLALRLLRISVLGPLEPARPTNVEQAVCDVPGLRPTTPTILPAQAERGRAQRCES